MPVNRLGCPTVDATIMLCSNKGAMLNMILNERELREARAQISALDAALSSEHVLEPMIVGLPPEVAAQVMRAMKVERSELSSLVSAYESARDRGDHDALRKRAGADPGLTLIVARIAKNLSQKELAWRLGLKEQQIQRYESDRYSNISLKNYAKIAVLLGVNLRAEILDLKEFRGIEHLIENVSKADIRKILKHGRESGWFSNEADESDLKRFIADNKIAFGSPSLLRTGLNVRDHSDDILLHAWRARVSKRAREVIADVKPQYNPLALTWVPELARLSIYDDGPKRAQEMMLEHGIVLIVEPQIPGLMIDGAAFLEGEIPVIGMTIRKDSIDNFWFTLLHEIAHATLHYRTGLRIGFFDQAEAEAVDEQETEANLFASNVLIPEERWRRSAARIAKSPAVIERFARELGVHPSIVFGRIRKERDDYSIFSQNIGLGKIRDAMIGNF